MLTLHREVSWLGHSPSADEAAKAGAANERNVSRVSTLVIARGLLFFMLRKKIGKLGTKYP